MKPVKLFPLLWVRGTIIKADSFLFATITVSPGFELPILNVVTGVPPSPPQFAEDSYLVAVANIVPIFVFILTFPSVKKHKLYIWFAGLLQ